MQSGAWRCRWGQPVHSIVPPLLLAGSLFGFNPRRRRMMGFRECQHERIDRRAEQFLRDKLHPEEVIEAVTTGQVRPRGWFGLELLFGVRRSVHARTDGCCSTCGGSVA